MVEQGISSGDLGWSIRTIQKVSRDGSVVLNDGITFASPCFKGAREGDTWAVKHEEIGNMAFGMIREAVLLESHGRHIVFCVGLKEAPCND